MPHFAPSSPCQLGMKMRKSPTDREKKKPKKSFKIIFSRWRRGLNTVALIKLIRIDANIKLGNAATIVDQILENKDQTILLEDEEKARHLAKEANELGVFTKLIDLSSYKRYRCAVCKKKSPHKIPQPPYYCPSCRSTFEEE